jgi:hypothetical protein
MGATLSSRELASAIEITNESDHLVLIWLDRIARVASVPPKAAVVVAIRPPSRSGAPARLQPRRTARRQSQLRATCVLPILGGITISLGVIQLDLAPQSAHGRARAKGTIVPLRRVSIPPLPIAAFAFKLVLVWQRGLRRRLRARAVQQAVRRKALCDTAATAIQRVARVWASRTLRQCDICLDDFPSPLLVKLASCRQHPVCAPCARLYVDSQLGDGKLHVPCPGAGCGVLLSNLALTAHGSADALVQQHRRLAARHKDRLTTETDPGFLDFCRYGGARRCPGCGVLIWRSGGCDHMRCVCGYAFDWRAREARIVSPRAGWCVPGWLPR